MSNHASLDTKSQISNNKSQKISIIQKSNPKRFDLEDRTFIFAEKTRKFINQLSKGVAMGNDCRQLIRSSGSVGANYIEANSALGRKDFIMRIKICKKETRESNFWLRLIITDIDPEHQNIANELIQETIELSSIFGAILKKFVDKTV